jgi:hypothetical protein
MQHKDDMEDDPVLVKYAGVGALAEAREMCREKGERWTSEVRYELIDQHVSMAIADGCTRKQAISYAMERFRVVERTVETALAFMDRKGRAPRRVSDGLEDF